MNTSRHMLKKLLFVFCFITGMQLSQAQKTGYGFKVGINHSYLVNNGSRDITKSINNVSFGLFYAKRLSYSTRIQYELNLNNVGGEFTPDNIEGGIPNNTEQATAEQRLTYLNFPILAKFFMSQRFHFMAGPYFNTILAAEITYESDFEFPEITNVAIDNKDDIRPYEMGAILAAGYETRKGMLFEIRYNHGLTDISDLKGFTQYNRGFQFSVGWVF